MFNSQKIMEDSDYDPSSSYEEDDTEEEVSYV